MKFSPKIFISRNFMLYKGIKTVIFEVTGKKFGFDETMF